MSESIVFKPVVPTLTVTRIDSEDEIKSLGELIRSHRELFYGFERKNIGRMRVRKDMIYIPSHTSTHNLPDEDDVILSKGDYLVTSENGLRYITKDRLVKHGVFQNFPAELFIPIEGRKVEN